MRSRHLTILAFLCAPLLCAQGIKKAAAESALDFAERYKPAHSELAHEVIETTEWSTPRKSIIAFYSHKKMVAVPPEGKQKGYTFAANEIVGYLFLPEAGRAYRRILISNFEEDGGSPEIRTVFFGTVAGVRKMFIICAWPQIHYDYDGTFYSVYVFNPPQGSQEIASLQPDEQLTKLFDSQCDCSFRDGRVKTAKYNTVAKVRSALRAMKTNPTWKP